MTTLPVLYEDVLVLTPEQPDTRGRVIGFAHNHDDNCTNVLVQLRETRWVRPDGERPDQATFTVSVIVVHPDNLAAVADRVPA